MKIVLELDVNEVQLILNGLGKLPAEYSMETILKIKAEAEKQITEQQSKNNTLPIDKTGK
jgi:hypothetical protein